MNKEFVPYEQALALKELGFDEPCFTKFEDYFDKTKLHPILATLCLNSPYENEYNGYDQKIINDDTKRYFFTGYKNSVKDHNQNILSAPTFSQVFKWFREKKFRISFIDSCDDSKTPYSFCINQEYFYDCGSGEKWYSTYEEAELECLKKLIEIVKNK